MTEPASRAAPPATTDTTPTTPVTPVAPSTNKKTKGNKKTTNDPNEAARQLQAKIAQLEQDQAGRTEEDAEIGEY